MLFYTFSPVSSTKYEVDPNLIKIESINTAPVDGSGNGTAVIVYAPL